VLTRNIRHAILLVQTIIQVNRQVWVVSNIFLEHDCNRILKAVHQVKLDSDEV